MLEAIARLRNRLGTVVFLWNRSHVGATPSSYADLAAKTYLNTKREEEITSTIADLVHARPCVYERYLTGGATPQRCGAWQTGR